VFGLIGLDADVAFRRDFFGATKLRNVSVPTWITDGLDVDVAFQGGRGPDKRMVQDGPSPNSVRIRNTELVHRDGLR
jgi:hypothetical protein